MTRLLDGGSMVVMDSDSSVRTTGGRIDGAEVVVCGTDPRRKGGARAAQDAARSAVPVRCRGLVAGVRAAGQVVSAGRPERDDVRAETGDHRASRHR